MQTFDSSSTLPLIRFVARVQFLPEKYSYFRRVDRASAQLASGEESAPIDCVICMAAVDISQRCNECMVCMLPPSRSRPLSLHPLTSNLLCAGDSLRPFFPHGVLATVDGHQNGMPNVQAAASSDVVGCKLWLASLLQLWQQQMERGQLAAVNFNFSFFLF